MKLMKRSIRTLLVLSLIALAAHALPEEHEKNHVRPKVRTTPANLRGEEAQGVALYKRVLPTVVTIFTRSLQGSSLGSGVLIAPDCHVLTAAHVVAGAEFIFVKTQDGKMRPAQVVYSERGADIALVRLTKPDADLPHAELGDSDRLAVGQRTYVIGSPNGLENSFSVGHISAFREFGRLYDGAILAEFIQTDAALNSGNSGGPMFNSSGQVIGIASRIVTRGGGSNGLGFVVAINTAKQLLALKQRVWIGMDGLFLKRELLARLLQVDSDGGLLLQHVVRGSPADKAGLRGGSIKAKIAGREILLGGDLILQIGEQEACHAACLVHAGRHLGKASRVQVTFLRGGKRMRAVIDLSSSRRNLLEAAR